MSAEKLKVRPTLWQSIQQNMTWRAVLIAGVVAGVAFLLVNAIFMPALLQLDVTLLLRYMASLLLGSDVLIGLQETTVIVGAALLVHFTLSILFTLLIAIVIHRWGLLIGIIGGAVLGLCVYLVNLYTGTLIFDWFFAIDSQVLLLSHVVFGAVAGGVYELFDHYDEGLEVNHATA